MKKSLLAVASAITILASGSVSAQTTMNGPYYANPSWDQTLPAAQRFIVLSNMNNAAVLDRETGLVWEQSPSQNTGTLESALTRCHQLTTGGRGGWHLPRVEELTSLLPLPVGHPFSNVLGAGFYWSNTPWAPGFTGQAIVFSDGIVNESDPVEDPEGGNNVAAAWCIRGGSGSAGTSANH